MMQSAAENPRPARPSSRDARFHPASLAWWLAACVLAAALVAEVAVALMSDLSFAPLIFFPLLIGLVLGTILVGILRLLQLAHRRTVIAGALLAGALTVLGQHYFSYRTDLRHRQEMFDQHPGASLAFADQLPESFADFLNQRAATGRPLFGKGLTVWLSWALDGLLVVIATSGIVVTALRAPYCEQCRSWYRTTRAGGLDTSRAKRLAALAGHQPPARCRFVRFRLQNCTGGCGPTGLELFWQRPRGGATVQRAWIAPARRGELNQLLDEATESPPPTDD